MLLSFAQPVVLSCWTWIEWNPICLHLGFGLALCFSFSFSFLESIKKVIQSVCFMRWHVRNWCLGGSLCLTYICLFWLSALMFSFVHLELIETLSGCVSILVCFSFSSSHLGIHPAGHIIGVFGDLMCLELVLRSFLIPDICFFCLPNLMFRLIELEFSETSWFWSGFCFSFFFFLSWNPLRSYNWYVWWADMGWIGALEVPHAWHAHFSHPTQCSISLILNWVKPYLFGSWFWSGFWLWRWTGIRSILYPHQENREGYQGDGEES